jgi:glyoxylase-like metal-dependent hydrolase (beta-lactamase superfamily II)
VKISEPAPGLIRIRLPLPFELNHVYVHVVRRGSGWMLIDTGLGNEACMETLDEAFIQAGILWRDIHDIFLTHTHPDHIGGAPELLKRTRARLWMSAGERDHLAEVATSAHVADWFTPTVRQAGAGEREIGEMEEVFASVRHKFVRLEPEHVLYGGERLETDLGPLETVYTPGHSAGHLALYQAGRRLLISGDHILTRITPNISWMPRRDMLGEYHESLDRVARLDVLEILPSHGGAFEGLAEWIESAKRHHEARCDGLLGGLAMGARTARELLPVLWSKPLAAWNLRFALFEVLAHLEYMLRRKRVIKIEGEIERWQVTTP